MQSFDTGLQPDAYRRATVHCNKKTRRLDSTFSLNLYFVFISVSAENVLSHIWRCIPKKKDKHLYCCDDCDTRGSTYRQTTATFPNFAEVNFWDFLLTGTDVEIVTYDRQGCGSGYFSIASASTIKKRLLILANLSFTAVKKCNHRYESGKND